ncbi:MAG: hypothetical protein RR551_08205 [Mucinivorans sp.]
MIKTDNYDMVIGIDPDVDKNGVAILYPHTKDITTHQMTFPELVGCLLQLRARSDANPELSMVVVVEAGYLNLSNWHAKGKSTKIAAAIGNHTGRNHQVARLIIQMAHSYGLDVVEKSPLRKCWKGKDGKITHEELAAFTRLVDRNNQEERDAALIAWNFAGLPIVIKPK